MYSVKLYVKDSYLAQANMKKLPIKSSSSPPMVFHIVPFIGSTITYGMDPYKFMFDNRKKVGYLMINMIYLTPCSMVMYSLSSFLVVK